MSGFTNAVCGGADVLRVIKFVFILLDLVNWIVPMALIVMISIDFAKNVMSNKEDEMKKNVTLVVKRIIFCIALFLIMPIVEFVIGMLGDTAASGDKSWLDCIDIAKNVDNFDEYEIDWEAGDSSSANPDKTVELPEFLKALTVDKQYTVPNGKVITGLTYGPRYRIVSGETLKYNPDTGKYHIYSAGKFNADSWSLEEIEKSANLEDA